MIFYFRRDKYKHNNELGSKIMAVEKTNSSSSLAEVIDRILDKGIVIDAWVRVSLVGIELLAIEARIVIASVETYLKYAEAVGLTQSAAVPA
ncbi:gas vesicle structural protein GvpA [Nostoc sphaeroides]|jgi:gas vesicle structural protein